MKKRIKIPIYHDILFIYVEDDLKRVCIEDDLECDAYVNSDKFGVYLHVDKNKLNLGILVHEVVHIVNVIFKRHYVRLDTENDEHQACFTEYIFNECYKVLKNYIR